MINYRCKLRKDAYKSMNIKRLISTLLWRTCVYFTVIILIYTAIVAILNTDAHEILVDGVRIMFFFIFSLLFSLANLIYRIKSFSSAIRLLLHYLITAFACYVCLFLPASLTPSGILVGIVLFSITYFIFVGALAIILSARKKHLEKKEVYEKKFSK